MENICFECVVGKITHVNYFLIPSYIAFNFGDFYESW